MCINFTEFPSEKGLIVYGQDLKELSIQDKFARRMAHKHFAQCAKDRGTASTETQERLDCWRGPAAEGSSRSHQCVRDKQLRDGTFGLLCTVWEERGHRNYHWTFNSSCLTLYPSTIWVTKCVLVRSLRLATALSILAGQICHVTLTSLDHTFKASNMPLTLLIL